MQIKFEGQYDKDLFFKAVAVANRPPKNRQRLFSILMVVAVGAIFLFQGSYTTTVEASVGEIVSEPLAYDTQIVLTNGIVTDWEIREYTVTVVGPDLNETFVITRYYLTMEDPETSEKLIEKIVSFLKPKKAATGKKKQKQK